MTSLDASHAEEQSLALLVRKESAFVIAHLMRLLRDIDRAEEVFQETLVSALETWARDGWPRNPGAWLTTAARNRAIDVLRRDKRIMRAHAEIATMQDLPGGEPLVPSLDELPAIEDDRLRLVFTCCHPILTVESQVALTLRLVGGLRPAEIARGFLTTEATIAQRLVRAKRAIQEAGVHYEIPSADSLDERLAAVLRVVYLVFNEGYVASGGDDLQRLDLAEEGLRLARCLVELVPDDIDARGLLALILLQGSRARARVDGAGELVLLEHQDRSLWDSERIARAVQELDGAVLTMERTKRAAGPYFIEAEIALCHASAKTFADTDWKRIAALYEILEGMTRSPVTRLNRAVAVSFAEGPRAGLELLRDIDESLHRYHLFEATRADLLLRAGEPDAAADAYEVAATLTDNAKEQAFLRKRAEECRAAKR